MTDKKQNSTALSKHWRDLLLLFAVPAAIAVLVIGVLYVPRLLAHPKYDFIYCQGYDCPGDFTVTLDGTVTTTPKRNLYSDPSTALYYYDTSRDSSRRLSLAGAQDYHVDASSRSPDGYQFVEQSHDSGFLLWGSYDRDVVLKNGAKVKPTSINGATTDNYLIGWVTHEK